MSSAYDIDAINRMLGLNSDGDVTIAVLPDLDDHEATQRDIEPWLPDHLPVRVTQLNRVINGTPVTIPPPSAPVRYTQVTQPGQKTNLMDAHRQWASRPKDERFWNLEELIQRTSACQRSSREIVVNPAELKVVSDGTDLQLVGGGLNGPARFTHWSFGQLSRLAGAPADYLRTLDGDLASECLNRGLQKRTESGKAGSHVLVRNVGISGITEHQTAKRIMLRQRLPRRCVPCELDMPSLQLVLLRSFSQPTPRDLFFYISRRASRREIQLSVMRHSDFNSVTGSNCQQLFNFFFGWRQCSCRTFR